MIELPNENREISRIIIEDLSKGVKVTKEYNDGSSQSEDVEAMVFGSPGVSWVCGTPNSAIAVWATLTAHLADQIDPSIRSKIFKKVFRMFEKTFKQQGDLTTNLQKNLKEDTPPEAAEIVNKLLDKLNGKKSKSENKGEDESSG